MIALVEFFDYRPSLFSARKYKIIVAIIFATLINIQLSLGQEVNAYRTIASGNFHNPGIWQRYTGDTWVAATVKPTRSNDIYIENPHSVRLTQTEEVKSIYLNADAGAEQKLNINGHQIKVYGSLNAFSGVAPGIPRGSFLATDWIGNSVQSRLVFKGPSRTIIRAGAWSAQNTNSRYTVIFDPDEGAELIVERPFKASQFIFRSGKVIQRILVGGECATFSFNTNFAQFPGIYGNLIIEAGATLESECNNNISLRSVNSNTPSALFDLQAGGELTLLGNNPQIHSADIRFDGTVRYASSGGNQNFVTSNLAGSMVQRHYRDLHFINNSIKVMPPTLNVSGDFIKAAGSGMVADNSTDFTLSGELDQMVSDPDFHPTHFTLDKGNGIAFMHQDLKIKRDFNMVRGSLDFMGNQLLFQTTFGGIYTYTSGRWINLDQVIYMETPYELNETNATFPFNDDELGGVRKLSLVGTGTEDAPLSALGIKYVQIPGVNNSPDFADHDGTPILYKTNSYFEFLISPRTDNEVEMLIDADDLIVLDPAHLRIVGEDGPAPGEHLEGIEVGDQFIARRLLTFSQLFNETFSIGSMGMPSILPTLWLQLEAMAVQEGIKISWIDDKEDPGEVFTVRRSIHNIENFREIGQIDKNAMMDSLHRIEFLDTTLMNSGWLYYQIEKINAEGLSNISPVIRVHWTQEKQRLFKIYPIPYSSGPLGFELVENIKVEQGSIKVFDKRGNLLLFHEGELNNIEESVVNNLKLLSPGLYVIEVHTAKDRQMVKWIRR